MTYKGLA